MDEGCIACGGDNILHIMIDGDIIFYKCKECEFTWNSLTPWEIIDRLSEFWAISKKCARIITRIRGISAKFWWEQTIFDDKHNVWVDVSVNNEKLKKCRKECVKIE